jgi:O-antigen ligase
VLNKSPLSIWLSKIKLAHISLVLAGLMLVFPFLQYRHENPLTTFDQEWWSALLGLLALSALFARDFWRQPDVPRIAQLPIALIVVVLLQLTLGKLAYFNQALLYILYLMFAALMMLLGAKLRACFGIEKLAAALAVFLLIGAELNTLIGVLQHYQLHTPLDAVVVMQISASVYGNLAQPNHFADYIALGMVSLGLLFHQRKLRSSHVILLAVPLLFALTLSGSRSSWLYMLVIVGFAWWLARRDITLRPLLRYGVLLVVGFGLMNLLVQMSFMTGADSGTDTLQRLIANNGGDTNGSIRLHLWYEACLIFMQAPWLGVGFGQFAWHHFELLPVLRAGNISGLYNNAHNLIFQLAAETGLAGLLALFVSLGIWLHGLRGVKPGAAYWWGYASLGVLAIHSLLEYPLWYAYFLAVAAVLLGAFDETRYRLTAPRLWSVSLLAILLLGLVSLVHLRGDYRQLKGTSAIASASDAAEANRRIRENLLAVQGGSLLSPYAEMMILSLAEVNADHIKQKIALGNNVMHFDPIAAAVYRQAYFLAQDGQPDAARQLLDQAIWSYPGNSEAHKLLLDLAEKDPAHFSALLEFANRKEQERARAVHQ